MDSGLAFVAILEGIANEILKDLLEVRLAHEHLWQLVISYRGIAFSDRFRQA